MSVQLKVLADVAPEWRNHVQTWRDCTQCRIGEIANKHVFARGVLPCDILLLGEAPGDTEDSTGFPFVGRAGKLLDDFVVKITWERERRHRDRGGQDYVVPLQYAIANVVLCKPQDGPGQRFREPSEQEKHNCRPRLITFIQKIAKPQAIIYLGRHAQRAGPFTDQDGATLPSTYIKHPSAILRMGGTSSAIGAEVFATEIDKAVTFLNGVYGE